MKKISIIALLLFVFTALFACTDTPEEATTTDSPTMPTVTTTATRTTAQKPNPHIGLKYDRTKKADYTYTTKTFDEGTLKIKFPVFSGIKNKKVQAEINGLFQTTAEPLPVTQPPNDLIGYEYMDRRYEITLSTPDILSFVVTSYEKHAQNANNQSAIECHTIDLKTGKELYLEDFVDINEKIAAKMATTNHVWTVWSKHGMSDENPLGVWNGMCPNEEIILNDWRRTEEVYQGKYDGFYVTKDAIWVRFSTMVAAGQYIMVEIKNAWLPEYADN